jgi:hypothetical protein
MSHAVFQLRGKLLMIGRLQVQFLQPVHETLVESRALPVHRLQIDHCVKIFRRKITAANSGLAGNAKKLAHLLAAFVACRAERRNSCIQRHDRSMHARSRREGKAAFLQRLMPLAGRKKDMHAVGEKSFQRAVRVAGILGIENGAVIHVIPLSVQQGLYEERLILQKIMQAGRIGARKKARGDNGFSRIKVRFLHAMIRPAGEKCRAADNGMVTDADGFKHFSGECAAYAKRRRFVRQRLEEAHLLRRQSSGDFLWRFANSIRAKAEGNDGKGKAFNKSCQRLPGIMRRLRLQLILKDKKHMGVLFIDLCGINAAYIRFKPCIGDARHVSWRQKMCQRIGNKGITGITVHGLQPLRKAEGGAGRLQVNIMIKDKGADHVNLYLHRKDGIKKAPFS